MVFSPPKGFVSLAQVLDKPQGLHNVIGVVADLSTITQSRGTDLLCTFSIIDSTRSSADPFKVRIFKPKPEQFPEIRNIGDVVMLKGIKIWDRGTVGLASRTTEIVVFGGSSIPAPTFRERISGGHKLQFTRTPPSAVEPDTSEQMYVIDLRASVLDQLDLSKNEKAVGKSFDAKPEQLHVMPLTEAALFGPRFSLLRNIKGGNFFELIVEVAKIFTTGRNADIYVTDYSENLMLYDYQAPTEYGGGNQSWPGPFGQLTMAVTMWPPHDSAAHTIEIGDFVLLRNVCIKLSNAGKFEGRMSEDRKFPHQIDLHKLENDDPRLSQLMERKNLYKRRLMSTAGLTIDKKSSKNQVRKEKRKGVKEQEQRERVMAEMKLKKNSEVPLTNRHVRCPNPDKPLSSVSYILDHQFLSTATVEGIEFRLPFVNAKYRAQVRVVDYYPSNLESFSHSTYDDRYNPPKRAATAEDEDGNYPDCMEITPQPHKEWEWGFWLLVEDALPSAGEIPARMPLYVAMDGAECLLKLTATDLHADKSAVDRLKDKLFILWGNLHELREGNVQLPLAFGSKQLTNSPFECCIWEYGVEKDIITDDPLEKWQRMHRISGTSIM